MAEEPDRIRTNIEATRGELARSVDQLADRTVPSRVAMRRWTDMKQRLRGVSDTVMGTSSGGVHAAKGSARSAADQVQETARSAAGTVAGATSHAGDRAGELAGTVADQVRQAPHTLTSQTRGNPMAAGVIAFGIGLLTASLIPATDAERRAGQHLRDNADQLIEPVRQPAAEAAAHLRQDVGGTAREAAQRVGESARDAARTTADEARASASDLKEHSQRPAGGTPGMPA